MISKAKSIVLMVLLASCALLFTSCRGTLIRLQMDRDPYAVTFLQGKNEASILVESKRGYTLDMRNAIIEVEPPNEVRIIHTHRTIEIKIATEEEVEIIETMPVSVYFDNTEVVVGWHIRVVWGLE